MKLGERIVFSTYQILLVPVLICIGGLFAFFERGRERFLERLGFWGELREEVVWFHGASIGEVQGLLPLIRKWKAEFPHQKFLLTSTSPSALHDRALSEIEYLRLLPFDHVLCLRKALSQLEIRAFVFGETELWPGLLVELGRRKVQIHLVNGVISERTLKFYQSIFRLLPSAFTAISSISSSTKASHQRFCELSNKRSISSLTGNTKYDRARKFPLEHDDQRRARWFIGSCRIITLASIHPGEEQVFFSWMKRNLRQYPELRFVIAPRHSERFSYFDKALTSAGLAFVKRSTQAGPYEKQILLLDSLGELEELLSIASLTFVGGTLVELGGHNPLEPASYGNFIVVGPHYSKIKELVEALVEVHAASVLNTEASLLELLDSFSKNPEVFIQSGKNGEGVWRSFQGAVERTFSRISEPIE